MAQRARHRDPRPADPVRDADRLARARRRLAPRIGQARVARRGKAVVLGQRGIRRAAGRRDIVRSEEHTSELQSLMRISYAVFCLKKKKKTERHQENIMTKIYTTI